MKFNVKKFASILLAVVMLFSMFAVISASAAETNDAVGAGQLNVTGKSNFCTPGEAVSAATGKTITVAFTTPTDLSLVDIQWGMNYDKTKLQLTGVVGFSNDMLMNTNATSYNVMGSVSNNTTPFTLASGTELISFKFKVLAEGDTEVYLHVIDLMNRTAAGDKIIVNNGVVQTGGAFTVNAKSNFFAEGSYAFDDVSNYQDADGNVYVTVEYKFLDANKYIIDLDIDELTYDPAVLEWKEEYNTTGTGRNAYVELFPFATGFGTSSIHKTADGRIVGNYSGVKPAAYASTEDGEAVTVVKATFKVLNPSAGSTTVVCNVDTMALCDKTVKEPYMQYFAIDKKVVNEAVKKQATLTTTVAPANPAQSDIIIGDVDNDGEVTIKDVSLLQGYLSEFNNGVDMNDTLTFKRSDTNKDGRIDVRDVTEIQRFVAEIIKSF